MALKAHLKIRAPAEPSPQPQRRPSKRDLNALWDALMEEEPAPSKMVLDALWDNLMERAPDIELDLEQNSAKPKKRKPKKVETIKKKRTPKEVKRTSVFERLMGEDDF